MAVLDETRVPTPDLSGPTDEMKDKKAAQAILNSARGGTERLLKMYKNLRQPKASGGMIKKYSYGGRVAKSSAEKS